MSKNKERHTALGYKTSLKIRCETNKKLSELSKEMGMTKIDTIGALANICLILNKKMKGYLTILLDPKVKMKIYFDEDERTEVHF